MYWSEIKVRHHGEVERQRRDSGEMFHKEYVEIAVEHSLDS